MSFDSFIYLRLQVKLKETIDAAVMFKPHVVVTVD